MSMTTNRTNEQTDGHDDCVSRKVTYKKYGRIK